MLLNIKEKKVIRNEKTDISTDEYIEKLCFDVADLIEYARNLAVQQVNIVQLLTYYSIGKWIVEVQQKGESRARYGGRVIKKLSDKLQRKFGRGFSKSNLEYFRKFYLMYENRIAKQCFSNLLLKKPRHCLGN